VLLASDECDGRIVCRICGGVIEKKDSQESIHSEQILYGDLYTTMRQSDTSPIEDDPLGSLPLRNEFILFQKEQQKTAVVTSNTTEVDQGAGVEQGSRYQVLLSNCDC
jgi:hypothetical protein